MDAYISDFKNDDEAFSWARESRGCVLDAENHREIYCFRADH